ncbi:START-like domain superfamily [Sesbania bispinosa]|nr:START-like domain superfamily [Sesbania bispinosa]
MALLLTGKVTTESGIRSPAHKFFNVFAKQLHDLHNIVERVHEGKVHQGDWHGIGSIKNWTIIVDGKVETCKESIEAIDEKNMTATYNLYDGEMSKNYKIFKWTLQVIDKEGVGGVVKWTFDYEKLNEEIPPPYRYLDYISALTKDVDAHLLKGN